MELSFQRYMALYPNDIVNGTFDLPKKMYTFVLEVPEGVVGSGPFQKGPEGPPKY